MVPMLNAPYALGLCSLVPYGLIVYFYMFCGRLGYWNHYGKPIVALFFKNLATNGFDGTIISKRGEGQYNARKQPSDRKLNIFWSIVLFGEIMSESITNREEKQNEKEIDDEAAGKNGLEIC